MAFQKINPKPEYYRRREDCYLAAGKVDKAIADLKSAANIDEKKLWSDDSKLRFMADSLRSRDIEEIIESEICFGIVILRVHDHFDLKD